MSDALCIVGQTRSGLGAPQGFTILTDGSNVATLSWQTPPVVGHTGYVLVPLGQAPIMLSAQATSTSLPLSGPTCFLLVAHTAAAATGNTDILCAIPRAP
jgi:hypothetical protein